MKTLTKVTMNLSEKADLIDRLLSEPEVDLWTLRELALTEGGLINGKLETSLNILPHTTASH
jgi:hypothetical protein